MSTVSRRVSKRPSSQLLSQIKSKQTKLKEYEDNVEEEIDNAESYALLEGDEGSSSSQPQTAAGLGSNTKEFFFKINDQEDWAIMKVSSFEKLKEEIGLICDFNNNIRKDGNEENLDYIADKVKISAVRANKRILNETDYKSLRDHGEMIRIQI